ncbi:hypothetical protein ASG76_02305 [Nocardioides sp. Soil774]|uniref:DUF4062 domain-containing protein n=1 Tax=Nocardioides sp. Soil774 TaxID=1736408 RepID=UPI0006F6DF8D|nr:DUF4062 domain-containing protein [Nocardioides sp. Soil774]KRE97561.1 hypothetical protein ASG76_02305 [Nocardioides sp. Soil774]
MAQARIFIASRFEEFRSLRTLLQRNFVDVGLEVVNLDDGLADERSPGARSLKELAGCDAVVVLLGRTYSETMAPGREVSITEAEWDKAVTLGLPVYCFASDPNDMTPRARQFYERTQHPDLPTTGRLVGGEAPIDDVDAITNRILSKFYFSNDDADVGHGSGLLRELSFLGAEGLESYRLDERRVGHEPSAAKLVEARKDALLDLQDGQLRSAEERLSVVLRETSKYDDWATTYLYGRLLELQERRTQLTQLGEMALKAVRSARQTRYMPAADAAIIARREVAALCLLGRAQLLVGSPEDALASADQALTLRENSRDALALGLEAAIRLNERHKAKELAQQLFFYYPDFAVTLMRMPVVREDARVERDLIALTRDRHQKALRSAAPIGLDRTVASSKRLRDAVRCYRTDVALHRDEVSLRLRNLRTTGDTETARDLMQAFSDAFAPLPGLSGIEYVPEGRCKSGDITVPRKVETVGGQLSGRRFVRVLSRDHSRLQVSDVQVFVTDVTEDMEWIEQRPQVPKVLEEDPSLDLTGSLFDIPASAKAPSAPPLASIQNRKPWTPTSKPPTQVERTSTTRLASTQPRGQQAPTNKPPLTLAKKKESGAGGWALVVLVIACMVVWKLVAWIVPNSPDQGHDEAWKAFREAAIEAYPGAEKNIPSRQRPDDYIRCRDEGWNDIRFECQASWEVAGDRRVYVSATVSDDESLSVYDMDRWVVDD